MNRSPRRPAPLAVERLEDRLAPANLLLTNAVSIDWFNVPLPNPVYGQTLLLRAEWSSQGMTGAEPAVPVRYTVNGVPADSDPVQHTAGNGTWLWYRAGWYVGTSAVTVTVTVDPDNQIAETNESDNTITFNLTPVAPTNLPNKFLTPLGLTPNRDWLIAGYADVDPRWGTAADYRGGPYQYDGHDAIDARPWGFDSMDAGIPVLAAADGTVTQVQDGNFDRETTFNTRPPNYVRVAHGNGWETLYLHFAANTIAVKVGDQVRAGQLIGMTGSSGSSGAAHLHYTALYRGLPVEAGFAPSSYWVNPLPYAGDVPAFGHAAGVANYDFGPDVYEKISPIGSFPSAGSSSDSLYFWFEAFNVKPTDVITPKLYRPDGSLFSSYQYSPPGTELTFWRYFFLFNLGTFQSTPGTWHLAFDINGVEAKRTPFTINAAGEPSIRLSDAANRILLDGRTTPIDFGSVAQGGTAPQQSFTVKNHGYDTLTLSNVVLPPGFSLVSAPMSLAASSLGTVTVRMDAAVVGAKYGTMRFDTNDPDVGTFEFALSGTVTGTAPAGSPVIGAVGPATTFNHLSLPRPLSPATTVTDSNSANFGGGTLTAEFASFGAAADRLAIRNQGTGAGQIGVSGATVTFAGTPIGTFAGGTGTTPLVVTLNTAATVAATQALLRNLTYQNVGSATTQRKAVRYALADGTGNVSNLAVQHVSNSGVARNPAVAALPPRDVAQGSSLDYTGSFTDPHAFAWSATVDYGDGTGAQPLTLNPDKTFTLSHVYTAPAGPYSATVTVTSDVGGVSTAVMAVTVTAPAVQVTGVLVNGTAAPSANVTTSRLTSLVVSFDAAVTAADAGAFTLTRGATTVANGSGVSVSGFGTGTLTLTFTGTTGVEFGSLADGIWTLTTDLSKVHAGATVGTGTHTTNHVRRLYGDGNGDGLVNLVDFGEFGGTFGKGSAAPGYNYWFDYNGDGVINLVDFGAFGQRFGKGL